MGEKQSPETGDSRDMLEELRVLRKGWVRVPGGGLGLDLEAGPRGC